MAKLIVNRLLLGVLTLFAVSILIFVCTQILPGDVASAVLGQGAVPLDVLESAITRWIAAEQAR